MTGLRRLTRLVLFVFVLLGLVRAACADESVRELWRSRGLLRASAVNPTDGSVWFAEGANLVRLAANGERLSSDPVAGYPYALAVDPADGSCWATSEPDLTGLLHVAPDGTLLSTTAGNPCTSLTASPVDGAVWLNDWDGCPGYWCGGVMHASRVSASGVWTWRSEWTADESIAVSSADGSAWLTDTSTNEAVHVAPDGTEIRREPGIRRVYAIDPQDQSVWGIAADTPALAHFSSDGISRQEAAVTGLRPIETMAPSSFDGSIWV